MMESNMPDHDMAVSPQPITDDEIELFTLLDSAFERQKEGRVEFIAHWDELQSDQSKRLVASEFVVQEELDDEREPTDKMVLSISFESARDLAFWRHFLAAAIEKLQLTETAALKDAQSSVSLCVEQSGVTKVLETLHPLIQRTHFKSGQFTDIAGIVLHIPTQHTPTTQSNEELLSSLHDSVLEQLVWVARLCKKIQSFYSPYSLVRAAIDMFHFMSGCMKKCAEYGPDCDFGFCEVEDRTITKFSITDSHYRSFVIWKSCLCEAFNKLQIAYTVTKRAFDLEYHFFNSADVERVLEYVRTLCARTMFCASFADIHPSIVRKCTEILSAAGAIVVTITAQHPEENFDTFLEFIQAVKPLVVYYYRTGHAKEEPNFLLPLADLVEEVNIKEFHGSKLQPTPLSIIEAILGKKCKFLDIVSSSTAVSLDQAEQLVQFFHHLDKNVGLIIPAESGLSEEVQLGEYTLSTKGILGKTMRIKHMNVKGKFF